MLSSYAQELSRRSSNFGAAENFYQVLDEKEWKHILNPDRILLAATTLEPFVDLQALEAKVIDAVRSHPNISILIAQIKAQPANPIRDRDSKSHQESECTGAIFTFMSSSIESLANRERLSTVS